MIQSKANITGWLLILLLPLASARADELMKWERIPLQIPLKVGKERVIFVDKNVRVGFPPALNGKLRVQSTGGAVYLRAEHAFPQTRLQLQDVENGEVILLDLVAADQGPIEPVRIVYSGDLRTASRASDWAKQENTAVDEANVQGKCQNSADRTPITVLLTRYAAQSLYGPVRTLEPVSGIHPVNLPLPKRISTLYPSEPLEIVLLAGWGVANRQVVALKIRNTSGRKIVLDPRHLQGQFVTATFQHRWVGPMGSAEDTTTLYLVTAGRPEQAFIAEPAPQPQALGSAKKGRRHAN